MPVLLAVVTWPSYWPSAESEVRGQSSRALDWLDTQDAEIPRLKMFESVWTRGRLESRADPSKASTNSTPDGFHGARIALQVAASLLVASVNRV